MTRGAKPGHPYWPRKDGREPGLQFKPGHKYLGPNPGNKAGRKITIKGETKAALELAKESMPEIYRLMICRAKGELPDTPQSVQQQASEYLSDRVYGKRQSLEGNALPLVRLIGRIIIEDALEGRPFKEIQAVAIAERSIVDGDGG